MIGLTELQRDVMMELLNIGMGRAAAVLSEMFHEEVDLSIPFVDLLSRRTATGLIMEKGAERIVAVQQRFSGLFWGAALKHNGGRLHTIDVNIKKFESSRETFHRAGLEETILNHYGDAHQIIPMIAGPYDLVFIDADKESCRAYFELVWPKLRVGGSIVTDNSVTHRKELAEFVAFLRSRSDTSSIEIPIGNGIEWTVKR